MGLTRKEVDQIANTAADKVMDLKSGAMCECVDWFLVAMAAAEALEHNAVVSDMAGDLHEALKGTIPEEQLEDLELKHPLLQGYLTENFAEMVLSGSLGSIRHQCEVDTSSVKELADKGFDAIRKRDPTIAAESFTKVKVELMKLAGGICGKEEGNPGNPGRVRFDRGDIDSAIGAAKRLESDGDLYVFATYLGYTIDKSPPPGMQSYVIVHPDGTTETISRDPGKPGSTAKHKALEMLLERGLDYEYQRAGEAGGVTYREREIEVLAPPGYVFGPDMLTSLVCRSWQDVMDRLPYYELVPEESGNPGNPGDGEKPYYYDSGKDAFVCRICGGTYGYEPGEMESPFRGKPYYEKGILTHLEEDHGFIIKRSPTGGEPLEIKPPTV